MQVMKKSMLLKWGLEKYCLIFKTKPILNTRYYAATCKMYIKTYTQRDRELRTYTV